MASLKKINKQDSITGVTLTDLLGLVDTTKTKKITPILIKLLKNSERTREHYQMLDSRFKDLGSIPDTHKIISNYLLYGFCANGNDADLHMIFDFIEYAKKDKISIDYNNINSLKQIRDIVIETSLREETKRLNKEILTVYDDSEWLFIKPLSYEASRVYGAGTKWCTTSRENDSYFYRYSKNGVLTYVINKITKNKIAIYSSLEERLTFWDIEDRRVDSIETGIPQELLLKLMPKINITECPENYQFFSIENKMVESLGKKLNTEFPMDEEVGQYIEEIRENFEIANEVARPING
jgi:hypothetical protein